MSAPFSPEEWEKVERFGFDKPEDVETLDVVDDVEGMTFGTALVLAAVGVAGAIVLSAVALVLWQVAS